MKTNPNDPINMDGIAFDNMGQGYTSTELTECLGLTKREYFAALALQGMLASQISGYTSPEKQIARLPIKFTYGAVRMADMLIDELNKDDDGKDTSSEDN